MEEMKNLCLSPVCLLKNPSVVDCVNKVNVLQPLDEKQLLSEFILQYAEEEMVSISTRFGNYISFFRATSFDAMRFVSSFMKMGRSITLLTVSTFTVCAPGPLVLGDQTGRKSIQKWRSHQRYVCQLLAVILV